MPGAIQSTVDASILNAMRMRRLYADHALEEKLRILRRLRRRHEARSLPKETSTETSFIEQLFAKVLDYATLLSHDADQYHLYAKPHFSTPGQPRGRFPDFALGSFASAGEQVYLASAELKGPGADLDAPQDGDYKGLTPVQQAFHAAHGRSTCQWIIVSNIVELRLYRRVDLAQSTSQPPPPVATVDLCNIWDRRDLALLCAHFDRRALLGYLETRAGNVRSELMAALDRNHPATPLESRADHVRLILLFTPQTTAEWPMFLLEERLLDALTSNPMLPSFLGALDDISIQLADGYLFVSGAYLYSAIQCKVALSGEGQLQMSITKRLDANNALSAGWLVDAVRFFADILDRVFDNPDSATIAGRVSPELREVSGVVLQVSAALNLAEQQDEGKAAQNAIGADIPYAPVLHSGDALILDVVSELAIYFRGPKGGMKISRSKALSSHRPATKTQ